MEKDLELDKFIEEIGIAQPDTSDDNLSLDDASPDDTPLDPAPPADTPVDLPKDDKPTDTPPAGDTGESAELLELRQQVMELSRKLMEVQTAVPTPAVSTPAPATPTEPPKGQAPVQLWPALPNANEPLLTEEELDSIIDNPKLILQAIKKAEDRTTQNFTAALPSIIKAEVERQIIVTKAVTDFYDTNRDLIPFAQFVGLVMADIEKANPDKPYREIFTETAQTSRKRLGLKAPEIAADAERSTQDGKPAFAAGKRNNARPQTRKDQGINPDMLEVLSVV